MPATPTIAWISIAPVKSMALQALDEAEITAHGIPGDRRFALLDASSRQLVNAKRVGRLITIGPRVSPDGSHLTLAFPDGDVVAAPIERHGAGSGIFYGRERAVHLLGGPFGEAVSAFAGMALVLVEMARPGDGTDRADRAGAVSIADVAALAALAAAGGAEEPLDPRRFRMTVGIDGVPAYAEDAWLDREVGLGDAVVRPTGNVGRCAITTRDPDTGEPTFDTLRCLAQTRGHLAATESLPFGVWATVAKPGRVRVGDPVTVPDGPTA